jgi:hypothetical protein
MSGRAWLAVALLSACGASPLTTEPGGGPELQTPRDGGEAPDSGGCAPSCTPGQCGDDGCGGSCGECLVDCFAPPDGGVKVNANMMPLTAFVGELAPGAQACGVDGLLGAFEDGRYAGLAFGGVQPTMLDGEPVTACVVADFGRACRVDDGVGDLGAGYSFRVGGAVCGDAPGTGACRAYGSCGALDGTSIVTFAGKSLGDLRHVVNQTACGQGAFATWDLRFKAFTRTHELDAVRFLVACRPFTRCDASAANLELDSLVLTWRRR